VDEETVAEAIEELRAIGGNAWLFPCDPRDLAIDADTRADQVEHWRIETYRDHVAFGDAAVFWVTGKQAGAYALGRVAGEVFDVDGAARFPLELFVDLFEVPVRKAELLGDPRFVDAPIIRSPHAASPHLLTGEQLAAILDLAVVPWWARASSPLARRVAARIQDIVDAAATGPWDDLPVIALRNDDWADALGVSGHEVRQALKELFFVTRERALPDESLGFTFDTSR